MKKIFILAFAALFVVGMFAEVAVADERLQLSGAVRVRAWDWSTKSITLDPDGDGDFGDATAADSDQSYVDQRFRMGATINVADGVKAVLRFDFHEDTWGSDNHTLFSVRSAAAIQVDRAYMQVDKGMFGITAGQQLITLGNAEAYDNQTTGIKLQIKTPVLVTLGWTKEWERGSNEDEDGTEDVDTWLVNVGYAADNFSVDGYYAAAVDGEDDGYEPNVFGVAGTFNAGMLAFKGELDVFGGEIAGIDVMGLQFWGNVEAALADNLKVGLDLIYSDGNDSDDEIKITGLNDFGDFGIMDRGPMNTFIMPGGASDVFDPTPFAINDQLWEALADEAGIDAAYDDAAGVIGGQGGSIGGGAYVVFTAMEGLDLSAQVLFLTADEDYLWDDALTFNIGAEWAFAPNTTLAAQYHRTDWSSDASFLDDSLDVFGAKLQINF